MKDSIVIGCDGHPYIERDIDPLEDSGVPACADDVVPPADDEQPLVGTGIVGTTGGEICEELWWCNSHQRRATEKATTGYVCARRLGGILLPCRCVNLTGIAEIIEEP